LQLLGICTPNPIAYLERKRGLITKESYYISEFQEGCLLYQEDQERLDQTTVDAVITTFQRLNEAKLVHTDSKATNYIVNDNDIYILDLEDIKPYSIGLMKQSWLRFMRNWENKPHIYQQFLKTYAQAQTTKPVVYFYASSGNQPSGGVKVLYEHVEILRKHGIDAFIVHRKKKFRATWFENNVPVINKKDLNKLKLKPNDIVVIPEVKGPKLYKIAKGVRKVIFNQGAFYTFKRYSLKQDELDSAFLHPEVLATLAVSQNSYNYLRYTFPKLSLFRVFNAVDSDLYHYSETKKKQIAFMTRRNPEQVSQVINILKQRHALADYKLIEINNATPIEVAAIMRESLVYLCFGMQEGFQLPAAEAMACGCITIGFPGGGADEFMKNNFAFAINNGDVIQMAKTVEATLQQYDKFPEKFDEIRLNAATYISKNYSKRIQERSVMDFWRKFLDCED